MHLIISDLSVSCLMSCVMFFSLRDTEGYFQQASSFLAELCSNMHDTYVLSLIINNTLWLLGFLEFLGVFLGLLLGFFFFFF